MKRLLIHHAVPLSVDGTGSGLTFRQWIPEGPDKGVAIHTDELSVNLWMDRSCVDAFEPLTDELISKWVNIRVARVFVDVTTDVADELADFIEGSCAWPAGSASTLQSSDPVVRRLAEDYHDLGVRVLGAVENAVNRVVAWAYTECKHYWLSTRTGLVTMMMSRNNEFGARVQVNSGPAVRWCPPSRGDTMTIHSGPQDAAMGPADWTNVKQFIDGTERPRLALELLSNANALVSAGYYRSAIIEAVCALEVAVNRWAEKPAADKIRKELVGDGMDLKRRVEHLGFHNALRFLIPLVLAPGLLDSKALLEADRAVERRNNIVHRGQRHVSETYARRSVAAIRTVAELLATLTGGSQSPA